MSLFKAREWWATTSGYEEFHDLGCLCIGNLDNSMPPSSELLLSSVQQHSWLAAADILQLLTSIAYRYMHLLESSNLCCKVASLPQTRLQWAVSRGWFVSTGLSPAPSRPTICSLSTRRARLSSSWRLADSYSQYHMCTMIL